jgi:pyruvate/2-oxoglutarate dehydrogenase complex dihydrolipoamide acyltransferase (E2) component
MEIKLQDSAWDGAQDGVEALLDNWAVAEKAAVKKGQVLVTVVLVKASIDIKAPADGWIDQVLVKAGESFAPNTALAHFHEA